MSNDREKMEREHVEKIFKRLQNTYPFAFGVFTQISNNFSKIYAEVNPDSKFEEGETKYLTTGVGLDDEGKPRLAMGENATIFYTAVAHTMLEFIQKAVLPDKNMEDLEKEQALENKICPNPNCGAINKITEQYCLKCGTKLP